MVKQSLKKQPSHRRDTTPKTRPDWSQCPPHFSEIAARVQGIQWLKWLHLKEPKQSNRGNEEKRNVGQGVGRTLSRSDERRNPHNSGRTDRNWSEVLRIHAPGAEHD